LLQGRGGTVDLLFQVPDLIPRLVEIGPGLIVRGLKGPRIDTAQQIALPDILVIHKRDRHDRAGNTRRDLNDIGADLPITRPGMDDILPVLQDDHTQCDNNKGRCQTDFC